MELIHRFSAFLFRDLRMKKEYIKEEVKEDVMTHSLSIPAPERVAGSLPRASAGAYTPPLNGIDHNVRLYSNTGRKCHG